MSKQFLLTALVTHEDGHTREDVVKWYNRAFFAAHDLAGSDGRPIDIPSFTDGEIRIYHEGGGPPLDFRIRPYEHGVAVGATVGDEDLGEAVLDYCDNRLSVKSNTVKDIGGEPDNVDSFELIDDVAGRIKRIEEAKEKPVAEPATLTLVAEDLARIDELREKLRPRTISVGERANTSWSVLEDLLALLAEAGKRK